MTSAELAALSSPNHHQSLAISVRSACHCQLPISTVAAGLAALPSPSHLNVSKPRLSSVFTLTLTDVLIADATSLLSPPPRVRPSLPSREKTSRQPSFTAVSKSNLE